MNNNIMTKTLMSALLFVIMTNAVSATLTIDTAKINDQVLTSGVTTLSIQTGQSFDVNLVLTSTEQLYNVEAQAFISGYENNDIQRIFDSTSTFDMAANVSYYKKLTLTIPNDANTDTYKLRVVVADRNNDALVQNYELHVDAPRHLIHIADVTVFSGGTENQVVSGDPLLVNVRVKNLGDRNEDNIKVSVGIPQLGLLGTNYIDNIQSQQTQETGSMYFKLPACVQPGIYPVQIEASFDNNQRTVTDNSHAVTVLKNDACDQKQQEQKTVVVEVQTSPQQPEQTTTQEPATADTNSTNNSLAKIRSALEIFLVVLFAIFIVIGIIVFFTRLMNNQDDE